MGILLGLVVLADSSVVWGPLIALITAVIVALVGGHFQFKSAETTQKAAENSVLLTGYNQLVTSLQAQVNEVQKDNLASTERAITAEATAQRAILAMQECEKRREEDKTEYRLELQKVIKKHEDDISLLQQKHDKELATLSRQIAVIQIQQKQGDT